MLLGRGRLVHLVSRLPREGGRVKGLLLPLEGGGKGRGFNIFLRSSFNADDGRSKGEPDASLLAPFASSSAATAAAEGSSLSHSFVARRRDCRSKCNCWAERATARL